MKIAFFEIQNWEKKILKKQLKNHELIFFKETLEQEYIKKIKNIDLLSVFIYSKVNKKILSQLPKLKMINTRSTGFDHIDLKEVKKRKIVVCNVPSYGENTVAEHTFALILALSRNIHKTYLRTTRENYSIEGLKGFDLKNKTIGVIGAGKIGLNVIKIAKGFDMNVLAYDAYPNNFMADILDFQYVELNEIFKKSDIISLHTPYNENTHHLINKKNINLIKKGAILINTARGGIVQTEALIEALDKKIILGAGLDVLEGEELIKEEKQLLYDDKKVI
jgi:D-lactate dehydrogenase